MSSTISADSAAGDLSLEEVMIEQQSANLQATSQATWLGNFVAEFIGNQRDRFIGNCRPLRPHHIERMSPYFAIEDLERVRFRNIYPERIPNPQFYSGLQSVGFEDLPDFGERRAVTFDQVIVTHEPFTPALLFHELVHTVQYRLLGVDGFARAYVQALLAGERCGQTALEQCAHALEERFVHGSDRIDVEGEVRRWLVAENIQPLPRIADERRSFGSVAGSRWAAFAAFLRTTPGTHRSAGIQ